jgi:hypothetical protein
MTRSIIDDSRVMLQLAASFTIINFVCHIFIVQTPDVHPSRLVYIGDSDSNTRQSLLTCLGHLGRKDRDRNDPNCQGK